MAQSKLYIRLSVDDDGYIQLHDFSDYKSEGDLHDNFTFVEALFSPEMETLDTHFIPITKLENKYARNEDERFIDFPFMEYTTSFKVPSDGEYYYFKALVPTLKHLGKRDGYYAEDGKLFLKAKGHILPKEVYDLYEVLTEENSPYVDEVSFFTENFFSIAYLNHCLLNVEKQLLEGYVCSQSGACNKQSTNSELQYNRDLLLDAHRVLLWLIAKKNFTEAAKILSRITNCGSLCKGKPRGDSASCGCGRSV